MDTNDVISKLEELRDYVHELNRKVEDLQRQIDWLMKHKQPLEVRFGRQ